MEISLAGRYWLYLINHLIFLVKLWLANAIFRLSRSPKHLFRPLAGYPCFLYVFGITKNTSNYRSGSLKVIPLILPLEENFIQPEHYPNQSDNQ